MVITNTRELDKLRDRIPNLINIARVAIIFPLLIMHAFGIYGEANLNHSWASWAFYIWLTIAAWLVLFSLLKPDWQWQSLKMPSASAVIDISMIGILIYLFGGIDSGLGILILPFVGSSCLLSYGRYPLLYSSYAAMLLMINAVSDGSITLYPWSWDNRIVVNTFVLIAASHFVAMLASFAFRYIERAGQLANNNHIAYRRIKGLNQLVLNRVQEAVVVIDTEQKTVLFNKKAKDLLPHLEVGQQISLFESVFVLWDQKSSKTYEANIDTETLSARIRAVPMNKEHNNLLILYIRPQNELQADALSVKLAALGRLTANLAHEIRNPMSAIRHANDLLREDEENDPFKTKLCDIIDSNIQRIDKMLEDISALNKRNQAVREPINLMKFWLTFKQEFLLSNPEAVGCIRLHMNGNYLTALFDPAHLQQILWNLCNNAWRHCQKTKGSITVTITQGRRGYISLIVSDNGPGVPPEIREHLFEPFYTTEKSGTGLGLYVSRELAHANFGDLTYRPEIKSFELTLTEEKQ